MAVKHQPPPEGGGVMTSAEHAAEAEALIAGVTDRDAPAALITVTAEVAQVHATLAVFRQLADIEKTLGGIRDEIKGLR